MKYSLKTGSLALALASLPLVGHSATIDVEIKNLTQGIYFTPLLVAAHSADASVFSAGTTASANLQAMAEGGSIDGLSTDLTTAGATISANPANGLLAPGATTTTQLNTDDAAANTYLSVVAMMLPTNDGFVGVSGWAIPEEAGTYNVSLNAYDAGTEANDEILGGGAAGTPGFPAPEPVAAASGTGGTGMAGDAEGFVHIHRGVIGDNDLTGGLSDIVSTTHRWLNPVARITVTVN